jgi:hypothetical protein
MDRMPPAPEGPAGPTFSSRILEDDGQPASSASSYDGFAEAYEAETEANLINGYYMRPAILDLAVSSQVTCRFLARAVGEGVGFSLHLGAQTAHGEAVSTSPDYVREN